VAAPVVVVLAAGASERLGTPKALVRLRDHAPGTPLELLITAARAAFEDVLVVSGAEHDALVAAVAAAKVGTEAAGSAVGTIDVVRNPIWSAGRTGSVLAAHEARRGRDLCIAPVDVPLVSADVFRTLAAAWMESGTPANGWLAPHLGTGKDARYGHPVLLGRELLARLDRDRLDRPLWELRGLAAPLLGVRVEDAGILDDLDTQEDLESLRLRLGTDQGPC